MHADVQRRLHALAGSPQQCIRELRSKLRARRRIDTVREQQRRRRLQLIAIRDHLRSECATARSCCDPFRRTVRLRQQRRNDEALRRRQSGRDFAGQQVRCRADALQLAAEIDEVQIRLENLLLAPAALQRERQPRLIALVPPRSQSLARMRPRLQQRCDLHRDRARAAMASTHEPIARGANDAAPIDPAMLPEARVFAAYDCCDERGRDGRQRLPFEAPHFEVDARRIEYRAVAIEHERIRRREARAHGCEVRRLCRPRDRQRRREKHRERAEQNADASRHCLASTTTVAFGDSPNISGAYIASTRVAGSRNWPGLLRRTVYSTTQLPFGT